MCHKLMLCKLVLVLIFSTHLYAGPKEDTKFLVDRILGTSVTPAKFQEVENLVTLGQDKQAALVLVDHPDFYNVTLRSHFIQRATEESNKYYPLNDYTATLIGMVRDNIPYNRVLSDDILYIGGSGQGLPAYSATDNNHYEEMEKRAVDLSDPAKLVRTTQSGVAGAVLPANATAGIKTTRQSAKAFFSAGTNRAMIRFVFMNYLCRDLEAVHDISRPLTMVRQDVSRNYPFTQDCAGCHAGMDGIAGAYAYYEWDEETNQIQYTNNQVQGKYHINDNVFKKGYVTTDDRWINFWRVGQNSSLGWRATGGGIALNNDYGYSFGNGAKSLGIEIAGTKAFSACAVKQVFKRVCLKTDQQLSSTDLMTIENIATTFESNNYNYKNMWADVAVSCMD